MSSSPTRCTDHLPVLLIAGAFGFWLLVVGSFVASLPDQVASPDQPARQGRMAE